MKENDQVREEKQRMKKNEARRKMKEMSVCEYVT